jgi:NADPH:quinone reductase-like Zn-dependent oxidoreductase
MSKIPSTMRAAYINKYGDNTVVQVGELPVPTIGDNDVLVQVKAAGVNPLDIRIRDGKLKQVLPYKFPLMLGNDFAGVVVAVGSRVKSVRVGDEVYARTDTMRIGSFADYIAIHQDSVSQKPHNLSMNEAASLPLVALTAWQILVEKAHVQKGQKVLIHGGAGGVGSIAIQLAEYLGTFVATTASAADSDTVKKYGADQVIDYRTEDFSTILSDYDVVLDTRGGETLQKSLTVLKPGGQVISVNGTPDADMADEMQLGALLKLVFTAMSFRTNQKAKKLGVKYSFFFMKPSGAQLAKLTKLFESQKLRPVVDKVYPLESVKDALAYSESGKAKGKIVIRM